MILNYYNYVFITTMRATPIAYFHLTARKIAESIQGTDEAHADRLLWTHACLPCVCERSLYSLWFSLIVQGCAHLAI